MNAYNRIYEKPLGYTFSEGDERIIYNLFTSRLDDINISMIRIATALEKIEHQLEKERR